MAIRLVPRKPWRSPGDECFDALAASAQPAFPGMSPLPRLFALGLFVILAALSVMLASSAVYETKAAAASPAKPATTSAGAATPAARLAHFSHRATFPLALIGVVLALALVASLALNPNRSANSRPPFASRAEMGALATLARSSVAQGEELAHERSERQRAEADALLHQQLLNRSLEEKIRLGRDLHDGIIQSLYAAGLTIASARAVTKTDPADADRRLGQCLDHLNQAIRDVRTYIAGLAPENLRKSSFAGALDAAVQELGAGRETSFDVRIDEAATAQLSAEQAAETLQIAREAVSNSLRHGGASRVTVRLHPGDAEVCLLVQDNGKGFDASLVNPGRGLANMQARASHVGGVLRVESSESNGTRIVFTLPLRA
jgi:two-component system, NarL family, sensor histidine kinase DevS